MSNMRRLQARTQGLKKHHHIYIYLPCYIYILLILLIIPNNNKLNQTVKYHELKEGSASTMRRPAL